MMVTGHKTHSVFDRYHIFSPEDLRAATARMDARPGTGVGTAEAQRAIARHGPRELSR